MSGTRLGFAIALAIALRPSCGAWAEGAIAGDGNAYARIDTISCTITDAGSAWFRNVAERRLVARFNAKVEFAAARPEDVAQVRVTLGGNSFFQLPADYDPSAKTYGATMSFRDDRLSVDFSALQITGLTLELTFKDGVVVKKAFSLPPPGKAANEGERYVASPGYSGPWAAGMRRTLDVGEVSEALMEGADLVVRFRFRDDRADDGFLAFYSAGYKNVFATPYFVDPKSLKADARLNAGAGLYTDGRTNEYRIPLSEITSSKALGGRPPVAICLALRDASRFIASGTPRSAAYLSVSDPYPMPGLEPSI